MDGLMMHRPLSIIDLLKFAAETYPEGEIVSVRTEGDLHRTTYAKTLPRVARLAHGLAALGVKRGDRVATLAWNGYRHFELYYAISGMGAVCHTINPRLSAEQLLYIVGHAEDRVLFLDLTFVPLIAALAEHLPRDLRFVIMCDEAAMPGEPMFPALCYESLLAAQEERYLWPELGETTAAGLCYTSGTTGHPKGVLYSHRSSVLHAYSVALALNDSMREGSRVLPVVPLFHVNAWGLPYAAPLTGASLVFPGAALDGKSLFDLMDREQVVSAWGVPTVWLGLQAEIVARGRNPEGFGEVVVGGSAAPRSMIESFERSGVRVCHAWGMTEMSPLGTTGVLNRSMEALPFDEKMALKSLQGRRVNGVELKITDEEGAPLPHDGEAAGELFVRGNAVASGYFRNEEASAAALDAQGWFGTGDIASIDARGFVSIQDRAKDLIKSGGEWISSIDLENAVMAHPMVKNCAVIAVPHPKWDERPLLIVVPGEETPAKGVLLDLLAEHFAKWQLPDDVVFVEELPLTATGKVSKRELRAAYADHPLPSA